MLETTFPERRQAPRVNVPTGKATAERPVAVSVRLVDIAMSGVLFTSTVPLVVGQCASLRVRLGDRAIDTDIAVRRVSASRDKRTYTVGARFVGLTEPARRMLSEFLPGGGR